MVKGPGDRGELCQIKALTLNQHLLVGGDYNFFDWTHPREWHGAQSSWEQNTHQVEERQTGCQIEWSQAGGQCISGVSAGFCQTDVCLSSTAEARLLRLD